MKHQAQIITVAKSQIFWGAVLALVYGLMPCLGSAQEREVVAGGRLAYENHCMVCHGVSAKGDGVMVTFFLIEAQPADLTQLSKKNDGRFPFWHTYRVIDGRSELRGHGTREMPIWGAEFRLEESNSPAVEAAVRGQILQLVHYLQSIQEK